MKRIRSSVAHLGRSAVRVVKRTPKAPVGRITNDTIGEHRESALSRGRRFKYPMQYARHRLVINTILLSAALLVLLTLFGWWQLYLVQNTGAAFYRVTQALPLPVASVNGTPVRYSDYLMRYRSEIYWLTQNNQINVGTSDGQRQADYRKRQALDDAEAIAYARSIAVARDISISDQQIDAFVEQARQAQGVSISTEAYYSAQNDAYGWSEAEVRDNIRDSLLRRAVEFSVDDAARTESAAVLTAASAPNADFGAVTTAQANANVTTADSGTIPLDSEDPSGLIAAVRGLNPGQVSGLVHGVDGYYVVKLLEKTSTTIHYSYIKVALTQFDTNLANLRSGHKVNEFISIKSDS